MKTKTIRKRLISILLTVLMIAGLTAPAAYAITPNDMPNAPDIILDTETDVTIDVNGGYVYFRFIPEITDVYSFSSFATDGTDPMAYLYNSNYQDIDDNDDINGGNRNFRLTATLYAGTTYYFGARIYGTSTGSYPVKLEITHSYSTTELTPSTCQTAGSQTLTCTYCNYSYTKTLPLGDHSYEVISETPSSCISEGSRTSECTVCGFTLEEVIPKGDHNYEVVSETPSSCTSEGSRTYECTYCGDTYIEQTPESGHSWTYESNGDGTHKALCSVCSEEETQDCVFEGVTAYGVTVYTCTACGYSYSENFVGIAPVYGWYFEDGDDGWTFTELDEDNKTWERKSDSNNGYSHNGTGYIVSSYNANANVDDWAISPSFSLTAVSNATLSAWVKQYTLFEEKFEFYAGTSPDPELMTALSDTITAEKTYTNYTFDLSYYIGCPEVYVAIRHCDSYNQYLLYADDIEILTDYADNCTHSLVFKQACNATCLQDGYNTDCYVCEICKRMYYDADAAQPAISPDVVIPAYGHDWAEWETVNEPTCTQEGSAIRICERCGEQESKTIEKLPHPWGDPVPTNAGSHVYTCTACGETKYQYCIYTDIAESGISRHTCTICGYQYVSEAEGETFVCGWGFEDGNDGWEFYDADADGKNWEWYDSNGFLSSGMIISKSYDGQPIAPDNWAISPAFSLKNAESAYLSFYASGDVQYHNEVFAVYAGPRDRMIKLSADFTTGSDFEKYSFDLSRFAGMDDICVAIRHYNCYDNYHIMVDTVEIYATYNSCESHSLTLIPASNEANCTAGVHDVPYYKCEICGRTYLDAEGTQPVYINDLFTQPPLGHDWGEPVSSGNGTHTLTCSRCGDVTEEYCYMHTGTIENGIVEYICTFCPYSYTEIYGGVKDFIFWDFETQPTDWVAYDTDGDGYGWNWENSTSSDRFAYSGTCIIYSASWEDGNRLSPDNWIVSPAFSLENATDSTELSVWASGSSQSYCDEVFALYAGTTPDISQMTKVSPDYTTSYGYTEYTADLSDFEGEPEVYIAIRHYNCYDIYYLLVDNVSVRGECFADCNDHNLIEHPALVEPTCTEGSHSVAYYQCENCGRTFLDSAATQPVILSSLYEMPSLGHSWGTPQFIFNEDYSKATAVFTCERCQQAVEIGTEDITSAEYDYDINYTASVEFNDQLYSVTVSVEKNLIRFYGYNPSYIYDIQYVKNGDLLTDPGTPNCQDHLYFDGWYALKPEYTIDSPDGGPRVSTEEGLIPLALFLENWIDMEAENYFVRWDFANDTVEGELYLVPKFVASEFVYFFADIYDVYNDEEVPLGGLATEPAKPEREGYSFHGWYEPDPDAGWEEDSDGIPYIDIYDDNGDAYSVSLPAMLSDWIGYGADSYMRRWDFSSDEVWNPTTLYAKWTPAIEIRAHSLTLTGDIGINYYVEIADVLDTAYAEFTVNGNTVTVPVDLTDYSMSGDTKLYKFTCRVHPAQIDTPVSCVIVNGNNCSEESTYTVQTYLDEAMNDSQHSGNQLFMELASSIATYGYYANEYFGYDDNFTKHALFDDSILADITSENMSDFEQQIANYDGGVIYYGSSLVLNSQTTIRHYFYVPEGKTINDYSFSLVTEDGETELTPAENGEVYSVEIADIPAAELLTAFTVNVKDCQTGETVNTFTYSAISYVYRALKLYEENGPKVTAELVAAVKALAIYGSCSRSYFNYSENQPITD